MWHAGQRARTLRTLARAAGCQVRVVLDLPGDHGLERRWYNAHDTRVSPECKPRHVGPRVDNFACFRGAALCRSHSPKESRVTTTDRLAQILERLGALAQQPAQPLLSVEVSQSARGATQVTIKAYAASADEAAVAAQRV